MQLVLINAAGSYTAPVSAVAHTTDGAPIAGAATATTMVIVDSSGTYTFQKINATNVTGAIAAASGIAAEFDTTGALTFTGEIAAVAAPVALVGLVVNINGSVGSAVAVSGGEIRKNGNETAQSGSIESVGSVAAVVVTWSTGDPVTVEFAGSVGSVATVTNVVGEFVVTVDEFAGSVGSVAAPAASVSSNNVILPMCFITMTLVKIDGTPVGKATKALSNSIAAGGRATLIDGWDGVKVDASITLRDVISGKIITTDQISTVTDANGFAQLSVFQGYSVTIKCASLGSSVTVNTLGVNSVDVSTLL